MPHRIFRVIFAAIVLGGVTVLSLLPGQDLPSAPPTWPFTLPYFDKIVHFTFYFTSTLAFLYALGSRRVKRSAALRWGAVLFLALYGALIEVIQHFTPTRSFDPHDMLANTLGALTALLLVLIYLRFRGGPDYEPLIKFTFNASSSTRRHDRF